MPPVPTPMPVPLPLRGEVGRPPVVGVGVPVAAAAMGAGTHADAPRDIAITSTDLNYIRQWTCQTVTVSLWDTSTMYWEPSNIKKTTKLGLFETFIFVFSFSEPVEQKWTLTFVWLMCCSQSSGQRSKGRCTTCTHRQVSARGMILVFPGQSSCYWCLCPALKQGISTLELFCVELMEKLMLQNKLPLTNVNFVAGMIHYSLGQCHANSMNVCACPVYLKIWIL